MQPAPLHNIMELPGVVLESVLLFLPPPELARCEALTCHSLRSTLPGTFWERAITTGLSSFMPAHLYFDNGVNTSSEALSGLTGRDRYPGHAEQCDDEMAMLVCEAGLHGRRVQWEANVESVARKTRHVDLLVRVRVVMGRGGGAVAGKEVEQPREVGESCRVGMGSSGDRWRPPPSSTLKHRPAYGTDTLVRQGDPCGSCWVLSRQDRRRGCGGPAVSKTCSSARPPATEELDSPQRAAQLPPRR